MIIYLVYIFEEIISEILKFVYFSLTNEDILNNMDLLYRQKYNTF